MEYETVLSCKKFMKEHFDVAVRQLYNPFTGRKIKKGSSTYSTLYGEVKKYLENIDDEEYHTPLKIKNFIVDIVPPSGRVIDKILCKNVSDSDTIDVDWYKKVEKKFKAVSQTKCTTADIENNMETWKYDSGNMLCDEKEFDVMKEKWINSNIELYSFLDHYKPEIFKHKYLMKHLFQHNYSKDHFINHIRILCNIYLNKTYDTSTSIKPEHRYPVTMIGLWFYQPLIAIARKYLKKNKKKMEDFIVKSPQISSYQRTKFTYKDLSSIILAYMISSVKIEELKSFDKNDVHMEKLFREAVEFIRKENILNRVVYRQVFTDFIASRIRPYRWTNVKFNDLENFDKVIEYLENPKKNTIEKHSKEVISDDE